MQKLTKSDFTSNQEVRWCPGCGDYAILASVQKVMPELGIPRENIVFVSGIGCAGRFPYYMNTYGFHTIHGRAPAVATGLKVTRPELSVWIATGDGDALSIGGNHLMHTLRRNLDVNILLFNNRIYGLTKGQSSPTSELGKKTPSTPQGSFDRPIDPITIALAAGATFVARVLDVDAKGLQFVLKAAAAHKGTSFIEIYQNCNIFNDGAFSLLSDKQTREDHMLWLEDGAPLVYGKNRDHGLILTGSQLKNGALNEQIITHDVTDPTLPFMLAKLQSPVPMGIFRKVNEATYEDKLAHHVTENMAVKGKGDLEKLLASGQVWEVS